AAVRTEAAMALGRLAPEAREAVPALGQALLDQDARVSFQAAVALSHLGKSAVPELVKGLKADRTRGRVFAADALGDPGAAGRALGADARAAVPALVAALKDPEAAVLRAVRQALKGIDPEAAARAGLP